MSSNDLPSEKADFVDGRGLIIHVRPALMPVTFVKHHIGGEQQREEAQVPATQVVIEMPENYRQFTPDEVYQLVLPDHAKRGIRPAGAQSPREIVIATASNDERRMWEPSMKWAMDRLSKSELFDPSTLDDLSSYIEKRRKAAFPEKPVPHRH